MAKYQSPLNSVVGKLMFYYFLFFFIFEIFYNKNLKE